jgi:ABC-type sugar transport system permease subunit
MKQDETLAVNKKKAGKRRTTAFVYVGISWACIHFFVFWFCMNIGTVYNSFFTKNTSGGLNWNGINAYKDVFLFMTGKKYNGINNSRSFLNTFWIFVLAIFINLPITLLFSYMIFKKIKGYKVLRVGMYVPCVLSVVILCLFYQLMFSGTSSGSSLFSLLGKLGYSNEYVIQNGLFTDEKTAWRSLIIFSIWTGVNGNIIYFTSAMARLPDSVLESASLDGASEMKQFFSIVIPMIWPVITTMSITLIGGAINWFQPAQLIIGDNMAGSVGCGTIAWMIVSQVTGGTTIGFPAALGVVVAVFGGAFIVLFRTIMEKVFQGVEY